MTDIESFGHVTAPGGLFFFCQFENEAFVVLFCSREQPPTPFPVLHPCSDIPLVRDSGAALHLLLPVVHIPLSFLSVPSEHTLNSPASVSYISYCHHCCSLEQQLPVKPTEEPIRRWDLSYPCRDIRWETYPLRILKGYCIPSLSSRLKA